jgi:hypothetical protein
MRRIFHVFCGLLAVSLMLTSCLKSDDDDVTTYDDMAIKTFTLGTLNRYLHTTSSAGADSVYKATYTATSHRMNIDQMNYRISNVDSLPTGTDVAHVICNVTTKNSGYVYVKSMISDTLRYFTSGKDSIDFSQPRVFRVFSTDGSGHRDYTVSLSVRSQEAGKLIWTKMPAETVLPTTPGGDWARQETDVFDTNTNLLPTANISYTYWKLNNGMTYELLVGDNDLQETSAVVWRRLTDGDQPSKWVYMPLAEDNPFYLSKGVRYWLLPFTGGSVLAVNGSGKIYQSRDQGITWKSSLNLASPVTAVAAAATDNEGGIWLREASEAGSVWYGKMTK